MNFTAALVPSSVASDIFGRTFRRPALHITAWWTLLYAAAITPLTALSGLLFKRSIGSDLPPDQILTHQWLGISFTFILAGLTLWRWRLYRQNQHPSLAYIFFGLLAVAALIYQGTLGGAMAFG